MIGIQDDRREQIINELSHHLQDKIPSKELKLLETFTYRFSASFPIADLDALSIDEISAVLLSQWRFVYQRKPGETKVRIFNPTVENDGWKSKHTVIQISHDDMPFLVDSTRMEINRRNLQIHFIIHCGGLKVIRDKDHRITEIMPVGAVSPNAVSEAPIYIEVDRIIDLKVMENLRHDIEKSLNDVSLAVGDWRKMVDRVEQILSDLDQNPPPIDAAEIAETKDFLRWLVNNHFTFLGARDYKLIGNEKNRALQLIPGSGLGVLRDDNKITVSKSYAELPPQARKIALSKEILIIAKTNTRSSIHRDAYTDYIGVKRFNEQGDVIGERRFIGLYTSTVYNSSPRHIPLLRHKVARVIQELHFPPDSHSGKEVVHILETLPRDDLFQATHEELVHLTLGILQLQERKKIRLFVRKDAYGRYFSCLVYVPREIFTTDLTIAMQDILVESFQGLESSYTTYFSESVLARIHYIVRVNPKEPIDYDVDYIEKKLVAVARSWTDELKEQLMEEFGEVQGLKLFERYRKAFPGSYTEYYLPRAAIDDIHKMEALTKEEPLGMIFYKSGLSALRLKLFHAEYTIALSDVLPTLENMGLRIIGERPHEIIFKDGTIIWVNDFDMVFVKNKEIEISSIRDIFQDAFAHIWMKDAEDDGFNQLVLAAHLTWHETAIMRAYTKYLRQIGFTFSQNYIEQALVNNSTITKDLVDLFKQRFSPDNARIQKPDLGPLISKIEKSLDDVSSLDEDRILRKLLEVILATIRTSYYQKTKNGQQKNYTSFKFDPRQIADLPLPRPMYEIFVYSPRVEGIHLRAGKVARGGIRWSDRREDFRTEVLGLMKAQNVKNTVIVPMGAKGGFVPKQLPIDVDRDAVMKEVIESYSIFIRGMLDITDNLKENQIIPPKDVVRYDEDDAYLVVAADKGTATFSDIANRISLEYNFWLGDAFASGGSAGYDHKKMGITARGAWESVKRHFREININPETTDFTVIGIGDMSGDVFGNGMLLSKHIKLVAAFNHAHIFLDPNPNPAISFEERKRLFNLPRSTWLDYNPELFSAGGGVYNRSAKSIKLSPQIKEILNIKADTMVPNDLIKAILKSPVDLLWNGGIGTFVKASYESNADVGDRTNDGIRVDGNELSVRVVGEGGNLGFTQLGRVEYSLNNGIMYTDFIDNSAGVDCSDHEVNIKILLNKLVAKGTMTLQQRNQLLEQMTEEVARLVLRDNYEQTQMLSLEASVVLQTMDLFKRYMFETEKQGRLDRKLEFLPTEKQLEERKANGQGLTRPELAILLAYCKMFLKQDIMASDIPEEPYFIVCLKEEFPEILNTQYFNEVKEHSLRREIIATQLAKTVTDHMGINFVERLQRETGASISFIMRAYAVASSIFNLRDVWSQIEALDYKVAPAIQQKMMLQMYYLIRRCTRWFLRNREPNLDIETTIRDFLKPIAELTTQLPSLINPAELENYHSDIQILRDENVPESLAQIIASCNILFTSLDIVEGARISKFNTTEVAKTFYLLGAKLDLDWLRMQMITYPIENLWDELARSRFRDDIDKVQRSLSVSVISLKLKDRTIEERIEYWMQSHTDLYKRWQTLLSEIRASGGIGFVTYSVVLRELADFAQL